MTTTHYIASISPTGVVQITARTDAQLHMPLPGNSQFRHGGNPALLHPDVRDNPEAALVVLRDTCERRRDELIRDVLEATMRCNLVQACMDGRLTISPERIGDV